MTNLPGTQAPEVPCERTGERIRADVVVIGGGAAGLTAAQVAAAAGKQVILVEGGRLGGECLNTGCVPSKALLALAKRAHTACNAEDLGLTVLGTPEWRVVRSHLRRVRDQLRHADSPEALARAGVRVISGHARFTAPRTLGVKCDAGTFVLTARQFILATGSAVRVPPVPGLSDVPYLTHETLFDLPQQPTHLLILGGGPVGCEMAQAFARLGSDVTLVEQRASLLPDAEPEVSATLHAALTADGVTVHTGAGISHVTGTHGGVRALLPGGLTVDASHLLLATGKQPRVQDLGLDVIGAAHGDGGLTVDARMRSVTCSYLSGAGDVVGGPMFTHGATERGTLAALGTLGWWGRALAAVRARSGRVEGIPAVTFTDPEVAAWGLTEREAARRYGKRAQVVEYDFAHLDRAVSEGESGFVKLVALRGRFGTPLGARLVGAHVVGPRAGELAQLISAPARLGVHPLRVALLPAPYPTYAEAARQAHLGLFATARAFGRKRQARP